jgi:hypothetical protein
MHDLLRWLDGHARRATILLCGLCLGSQTSNAATWLDSLYLTFDTAQQSSVGVVLRQQVLKRPYAAASQILSPGLPANVGIAALALNGSNLLYTPDISFTLNGVLVTPRDVVSYTGSNSSIYLHGSALGLPANTRIDALALSGANVLFSLDARAQIGSQRVGPADVLQWNGSSVSIAYSASSLGLPPGTNLTALESLPNGHLLMGFDAAGKIGGVTYRAGEILEYTPSGGSWTLARSQSQLGVTCNPCRTRDIIAVGNVDEIYKNGFDSNEG